MNRHFLNTDDVLRWRSYIERLPEGLRDVHFLPEMMLPYEAVNQGRGLLIVDETEDGEFSMQPFLKQDNNVYRHPFNFGGPVATPGCHNAVEPYVEVHCTLNPFFAEYQTALLKRPIEYVKDSVWCDLTTEIKLRKTTTHCVNQAIKEGITVSLVEPTAENQDVFLEMYNYTMDRNAAADHWRFPKKWFATLLRHLPLNTQLMFACYDGKPETACILLYGYGTCYYHFSASYRQHYGAGQLMVLRALEWAKTQGLKRFHLGGGVVANDGLFTFKSGFSKLRAPVYRYTSKERVACRAA